MKFRELVVKLNNLSKETNMAESFDLISKIEQGEAISDCTIRQANVDPIEIMRAYERRAIRAEKRVKLLSEKLQSITTKPIEFSPELEIILNQVKSLYTTQKNLYELRMAALQADVKALNTLLKNERNKVVKMTDYRNP